MPRKPYIVVFVGLFLSACASLAPIPPTATPAPTSTPAPSPTPEWERTGWNLVWQDEFKGETLDLQKWTFDLGATGWGNGEMEEYTNRPENVRIENGNLIIEARKDPASPYGVTSARLKTQGLHDWQYGRIEGRIKLPQGQGIWPAFWMLGNNIGTTSWPKCGEIDILEMIGRQPNTIYNTVHGPGYSGSDGIGTHTDFPAGSLQNEFHVYAIEWEADQIRWYIDDTQVFKVSKADVPADKWVFDHPFFIILNVAVGGGWPGFPDATTVFPQQMLVDYIRVYQRP